MTEFRTRPREAATYDATVSAPGLPRVLCLSLPVELLQRIRAPLCTELSLVAFDQSGPLLAEVESVHGLVRAVVVCGSEAVDYDHLLFAHVRAIAAAAPLSQIVLVVRPSGRVAQNLCDLARAGVSKAFFYPPQSPDDLVRMLRGPWIDASAAVLRELGPSTPARLQSFVEYCVGPNGDQSIAEVAAVLGVNVSTLGRRCESRGWPPPEQSKGWLRLMLAAYLFETTNATAAVVAETLGFLSGSELKRRLRSYAGCSILQLKPDGLAHVKDQFLAGITRTLADRPSD
jgi:AraC-like DNA-binding protein